MQKLLYLFLILILPTFCVYCAPSPRIVSTSPALTELLYQLGYGEHLVATPMGSDYPESAKNLPIIGSLFFPSVEKTLRLNPDWILVDAYTENIPYVQAASNLGIKTLRIKIDSIENLKNESLKILKTIFKEETNRPFEQLVKVSEQRLKPIKTFTFLGLVWHQPSIVFGAKIFLSDLFSRIGGISIVPETMVGNYPLVTEEWLVKHPPEILFILSDSTLLSPEIMNSIKKWWPAKPPTIIPLPHKYFARTNFTAIQNLNTVTEKLSQ